MTEAAIASRGEGRLEAGLLVFVLAALVASGIAPYDRGTWILEVAPVAIVIPVLVATRTRFPLTRLLYVLIAVHALVLILGGAYTYARVPLGFWLQEVLGTERNPYDRVGHLMQGLVPALVAREILLRTRQVRGPRMAGFLAVCVAMAVSATYELLEWASALAFGQGADEFLGTQGDPWDTQSDMFCALIGSTLGVVLLGAWHDRLMLRREVAANGFAFVPGERLQALHGSPEAWSAFAATWEGMPLDEHLPDGHRYRRRRFATLSVAAGRADFTVEPHQPHYQAREYNRLVGGIERWFEPMPAAVLASEPFRRIVAFGNRLFGPLRPGRGWHVECHQFRIEARPEALGQPTPEGVHRDGVDFVLVLLVDRVNIESGTTTIHDEEGRLIDRFTLASPLDTALVDDARRRHGVTPVRPLDPTKPAHRDVLVVTWRAR